MEVRGQGFGFGVRGAGLPQQAQLAGVRTAAGELDGALGTAAAPHEEEELLARVRIRGRGRGRGRGRVRVRVRVS